MSGYRTPHYNKAIGNGQFSRHVWGGAADVFVDEDGNGVMDDLNRDGNVTRADSAWLSRFVDGMERRGQMDSLASAGRKRTTIPGQEFPPGGGAAPLRWFSVPAR